MLERAVYPNPFTDRLNLKFELAKAGEVTVELMDINGRLLDRQAINAKAGANNSTIESFGSLKAGVYFARISNGAETTMVRLVKE